MPSYPIDAATLLDLARGTLHKSVALTASWTVCATQAIARTYLDLSGPVLLKGYSASDLTSWDSWTACFEQQALWRLSELATNLAEYRYDPAKKVEDQRAIFEGDKWVLTVGGSAVAPTADNAVGGIGYGSINAVGAAEVCASLAWEGRNSPYWNGYW